MTGVQGALVILGLMGVGLMINKKTAFASSVPSGSSSDPWPYYSLIKKWAEKYGVDPALVAAHAKVESGFDPNSENIEDPSIDYDSSYGIMQVQLATAQDFGAVVDYRRATAAEKAWLLDPSNNIKVGAWNIARWQKKYPFDVAVQMYNVGEAGYNIRGYRAAAYLRKVTEAYNGYRED